jgi:hypothetical protein
MIEYVFYYISVASTYMPAILAAREPEGESGVFSGAELEARLEKSSRLNRG